MARKKVTSVPALADWGAVDNALRDIRECQHTLAEMAVQRDRQIDSIKADYAQGALPLQNRVKALESEVKAYRLCDASAWSADELTVTWGNGVLYDADQEWTERKELVQMGLLKPELALAWKFDLPAESEADLAEIRKNYMPELKDLEG